MSDRRYEAVAARSVARGIAAAALALLTHQANAALDFAPYVALPTGGSSNSVAIGDLDGDGRNDVVVAASDNRLMVFFQTPNGSLAAPVNVGATNGNSVVIADFTGDGRPGIATSTPSGIAVYSVAPDRTIAPRPIVGTAGYVHVEAADLDGDGRSDLVGMTWSASAVDVYYQLPGGDFGPAVPVAVNVGGWNDMKIVDLNGDGRKDIVYSSIQAGAGQQIGIVIQRPDGAFHPPYHPNVALGPFAPWGIAALDVNGDQAIDLVVTQAWNSPEARLVVMFNQGGSFDKLINVPSYDVPETIQVADVDRDGLDDIVVLHGGWLRAGIYTRLPGGGLAPEILLPIPYASHYDPQGLAIGDINNDGRPDLAIADYNSGLVLLYNLTGACMSFADVDATDPFCRNVEWLRNRAVTLGCAANNYCRNDPVSRTAMAAFMNRLGTALTPVVRERVQVLSSGVDLTAPSLVCPTTVVSATDYPRNLQIDAVFTGVAAGAADFAVWPVVSTDNGASWTTLGVVPALGHAGQGLWSNTRVNASDSLAAGSAAAFGLRIESVLGNTGGLTQASCNLRVRAASRNGDASPY